MELCGHGTVALRVEESPHGSALGRRPEARLDVEEALLAFAVVVVQAQAGGADGPGEGIAEGLRTKGPVPFNKEHPALGHAHAMQAHVEREGRVDLQKSRDDLVLLAHRGIAEFEVTPRRLAERMEEVGFSVRPLLDPRLIARLAVRVRVRDDDKAEACEKIIQILVALQPFKDERSKRLRPDGLIRMISGDEADVEWAVPQHHTVKGPPFFARSEFVKSGEVSMLLAGSAEGGYHFVVGAKVKRLSVDKITKHGYLLLHLNAGVQRTTRAFATFSAPAAARLLLPMKIAFAASECVPFVKTGGLADVVGSLPKALAALGHEVCVFLPLYQSIAVDEHDLHALDTLRGLAVRIGDQAVTFDVWAGPLPDSDVAVFLIDCPAYFHRPYVYSNDADEAERFILFQHGVLHTMQHLAWAPDVLHGHDWQAGLLPVFLRHPYAWDRLFTETATLYTIHNIGYQGRFHEAAVYTAGLSYEHYHPGGPFEFHDSFCFMKTGVVYADAVSTVSPTYAREIQTPEGGAGLDGVLRTRSADLHGILNGIDPTIWHPVHDALLPTNYDARTLDLKAENKKALLAEVGLPFDERTPVVGIIARFTGQKGFELLQPILADVLQQRRVQFVVLGSGEDHLERFFQWAADAFPERVAVYLGYNDRLSHLIEAGADLFLMPSAYEPCGLNQMYSLTYGTLPLVRRTGGLADTVRDYHAHRDAGNGFSFDDFTPYALYTTLNRALEVFEDLAAWRALQLRGMAEDFSWDVSAQKYAALYAQLAARKRTG